MKAADIGLVMETLNKHVHNQAPAVDNDKKHQFDGRDIVVGGSMTMPIDISVLATIMSITRNGR
jgi:hypothetical protein